MRTSFLISFLFFLPITLSAASFSGELTYYSDSFEGGRTANGSLFSQSYYSAALCPDLLGQLVHVSTESSSVVVLANDRPNCRKYPTIVDLTSRAFSIVAPLSVGRIASGVTVTPIGYPSTSDYVRKDLPRDVFAPLGVMLDTPFSNTAFTDETISLWWSVSENKKYVLVYLEHTTTHEKTSRLIPVDSSLRFRGSLPLPRTPGKYIFIIANGQSFNTSEIQEIFLINPGTLNYPALPTSNSRISLAPPTSLKGEPTLALPSPLWWQLTLTQDMKKWSTTGRVLTLDFAGLKPGRAEVLLEGYALSTESSLDRTRYYPALFSGSILLDRTHEKTGEKLIKVRVIKRIANVRFTVPDAPRIRPNYFVTLPDGDVREYPLAEQYVGKDGYLIPGKNVNLVFPMSTDGNYVFELVKEDGIAYVNTPISRGSVWSIITPLTESERTTVRKNLNLIRLDTLKRLNELRGGLDRNFLLLDDALSRVAQAKAEDMSGRGYVGHYAPDGKGIADIAKSLGYTSYTRIAENISFWQGTVSDLLLQDGLEESGSHRYSMLAPHFSKVGIGFVRSGDKSYLVQVFSD